MPLAKLNGLHPAARRLDPGPGLAAHGLDPDSQGHGNLTLTQELDAVHLALYQSGVAQDFLIHHAVGRKPGQIPQIYDGPGPLEFVPEASLGNPPEQGHLAALETGFEARPGTGFLSFMTPSGGFAPAGAGTAAHPFLLVTGTR